MRTKVDVLLLNIVPFVSDELRKQRDVFAPIGTAYLAAMAQSKGYSAISLPVGLNRPVAEEVRGALSDYDPDILGFSATGNDLRVLASSVEIASQLSNDSFIVVGGYASQRAEAVSAIPGVDAIVSGEGDLTFSQLIEKRKSGELPKMGSARLFHGENIKSLDELPIPTYRNYPTDGRYIRLYASRGCPYRCSFCQIKGFLGTPTIRYHSELYVARLLEKILKEHEVRPEIVLFNDDEFLLSPRHLVGMANLMRAFGLRMRFQTRVTDVLRHINALSSYRDTIDVVHLGVESFSDAQLGRWQKDATAEENKRAIAALSSLGIAYYPNIILSDAYTTPSEIKETIDAIIELPETGVWTGREMSRFRAQPHEIGLQINRYKDFFGQPERSKTHAYLESLWQFIGSTKRHSDRLETAFVNSTLHADSKAHEARTAIGDLLRDRLESISDMATRLVTVPEPERTALVELETRQFAQRTGRVLFGTLDLARIVG